MGEDTQGLKRDIEDTRGELTRDVDALAEKVSPSRIRRPKHGAHEGAAVECEGPGDGDRRGRRRLGPGRRLLCW